MPIDDTVWFQISAWKTFEHDCVYSSRRALDKSVDFYIFYIGLLSLCSLSHTLYHSKHIIASRRIGMEKKLGTFMILFGLGIL